MQQGGVGSGVGFERCGGIDFDSNGTLFAACQRTDGSDVAVLITINPNTGVGSKVGIMCGNTDALTNDLSYRNADDVLFGVIFEAIGCGGFGLTTFNTSNGAASPLGISGRNGCCGSALAFSPADTLFFGDNADLIHS